MHLSLLFTAMLCDSFVADNFRKEFIVPLLKSKHGDATSLDMYRGSTLSPELCSVFEAVLLRIYKEYLISDQLQYGFKENSSCAHVLFAVTESVKHFTNKGSKVYFGFLDATKANDKVLHNGIFKKLMEKNVPVAFIGIPHSWYNNLHCSVHWNNVIGESFVVKCGVRQGGVLFPYLFALYVDELIIEVRNSSYGLHIGQLFLGCAFYANDIALLSALCYGLQRLINICEQYGNAWEIRFNPTKSQLITFGGPNPSVCGIHINGNPIHWVNKIKYFGVDLLCNTGLTDIADSVRKFYEKFNNIMAVLSKHSNEMSTLHLVKSYCLPALLYGCEVWHLCRAGDFFQTNTHITTGNILLFWANNTTQSTIEFTHRE